MKIFAIVICILSGGLAHAQSLYNQSVISIGPSSILFVKDSITNEGTIINNGEIQVGGSWVNNNQYDAGQGQINFSSDLPQIINHHDQAFSKLTISGGGEKIFQANITIENELNLTDGILVSDNNARIIFNSTAVITGGSDGSHIKGPVYHQGPGAKTFPLGNGSVYLPVTLSSVEGTEPEVGITETELDGVTLPASPSLKAISGNRYFGIDVVSGSLAHSFISIPVRDENIVTDTAEVVVSESESLSANFESIGRSIFTGSETNGIATSKETVSKNLFAVATKADDGSIVVYNAISPNNDEKNEFLRIGNIESYPENTFSVFNRWGDKVFEISNYDNKERVFRGKTNINGEKDLVNGTYFYILETKKGSQKINGFLAVKN